MFLGRLDMCRKSPSRIRHPARGPAAAGTKLWWQEAAGSKLWRQERVGTKLQAAASKAAGI